ncbi:hypothetical protein [Haliangium ochraceum]|uniref:Uncharacterized protein n=1 Tax=Haliangium ochraceum (strain DSM 14365 / JCM 11303 / SMP-2) TaxID=502025 RepID=D0LVV7_HALO1|nr:hypothetical protein [Haliangium ochraceum]ACY14091.1 hypothetical protein Hoch_1539 [Haliangium ochraceum DSM 14365]
MSTTAEVIREFEEFLFSLDRLLASNTLEAIIDLVDSLGGGEPVEIAAQELADILRALEGQLVQLSAVVADPLRHAQAMAGLLGLLRPLLEGMEQLVATSAEALADAGLDQAIQISDPVRGSVDFAGRMLGAGEALLELLPRPEDLESLRQRVAALVETVQSYADISRDDGEDHGEEGEA